MSGRELPYRVVIHQRILHGSDNSNKLQKIATVYINGREHRVYAPSEASGNPLDWLSHLYVHQPSPIGFGGEFPTDGGTASYVINLVREELEKNSGQAGTEPNAISVGPYYHVRLHIWHDANIEVKFDLTRSQLDQRILEPYHDLRPIVIGGRTFSTEQIERVEVFETPYQSSKFQPLTPMLARSVKRDCFSGEPDVRDLTDELIITPSTTVLPQKTDAIELLCYRFHIVAQQLRQRHGSRTTLDVKDEYDVQDLLHALLRIFFDDVRAEEVTPSYAGKSSRMDFLLPLENMGVETKRSRLSLGAKELGSELIDDIARYKQHQFCKKLICFVYDPEGYVANPRGIETDLSRTESGLEVKVIIAP